MNLELDLMFDFQNTLYILYFGEYLSNRYGSRNYHYVVLCIWCDISLRCGAVEYCQDTYSLYTGCEVKR